MILLLHKQAIEREGKKKKKITAWANLYRQFELENPRKQQFYSDWSLPGVLDGAV